MVQMSKRPVNKRVLQRMMQLIFTVLGRQTSVSEFDHLTQGIFSPIEQTMVAKRMAIFLLLTKKIEWPNIQSTLKVSSTTISKCQMILVQNDVLQKTFQSIANKQDMHMFFEEVLNEIRGPGTFLSNWELGWKKRREMEKRKKQGI